MFEYETKISIARPNSESGRTTIPQEVMKFLDLSIGNSVKWIVKLDGDEVNVCLDKVE